MSASQPRTDTQSKYVEQLGKTQQKSGYSIGVQGFYGAGKSHMLGTMPNTYWISSDPNDVIARAKGLGIINYSGGKPSEIWEDWSRRTLPALHNRDLIRLGVHKDVAEQVETICLDAYTFLFEIMQEAVPMPTAKKTGDPDSYAWYRELRKAARQHMFALTGIVKPWPGDPNRPVWNLGVTYHMKAEYRDIPGTDKKVLESYVPAIEGQFKDKIGAYFNTLLWVELKGDKGVAYTKDPDKLRKTKDTIGGNRPGHAVLPPVIENTWPAILAGWGVEEQRSNR